MSCTEQTTVEEREESLVNILSFVSNYLLFYVALVKFCARRGKGEGGGRGLGHGVGGWIITAKIMANLY